MHLALITAFWILLGVCAYAHPLTIHHIVTDLSDADQNQDFCQDCHQVSDSHFSNGIGLNTNVKRGLYSSVSPVSAFNGRDVAFIDFKSNRCLKYNL